MSRTRVNGVAVHPIGEGQYCWVFLSSQDEAGRYTELLGDDEAYPSEDAALIAAYLALRRRLRKRAQHS
jgi:hypothetical protein